MRYPRASAQLVVLLGAALLLTACMAARIAPLPDVSASMLRPVSAFATINDQQARSRALFEEMGRVILSPRCLNCHPRTDQATQGDRMIVHRPMISRGPGGFGAAGMHCATCHHADNFDPAGVPGDPAWRMAPVAMGWQQLSLGQICSRIVDSRTNGGRGLPALVRHLREDHLVGWAWHPGAGRTSAPGTQQEFGDLANAWMLTGAHCPS